LNRQQQPLDFLQPRLRVFLGEARKFSAEWLTVFSNRLNCGMGYTKTDHYDGIIRRHIRSGRASNKTEVVHQALSLLDAVTRNRGPSGSSFANADELEA